MSDSLAIVSGGMDSVTLAYYLVDLGHQPDLLTFDYGQRHRREIEYAERCAEALGLRHDIIDLSDIGQLLVGSSLTDPSVDVPEGHYAAPNMVLTVVPNRNAMMLSVAFAVAAARHLDMVCIGVHSGDHPIYADCRPAFIRHFDAMEQVSLPDARIKLMAPFIHEAKDRIVALGDMLGVPYEDTWSCYQGGDFHCGKCGTCVERKEAFELAHVVDPTIYAA